MITKQMSELVYIYPILRIIQTFQRRGARGACGNRHGPGKEKGPLDVAPAVCWQR
jgi:hypothetical protein